MNLSHPIVSKLAPYSMCPPNISTTIDEINIHHKITFPGPYRKGCCQQSILSFGKLFRQSYYFSKPESDGLTDAFFYSHAKLFIFITQGPIQAPTWNCHSTAKRRTSFLNKRSSASASLSVIKKSHQAATPEHFSNSFTLNPCCLSSPSLWSLGFNWWLFWYVIWYMHQQ